MGYKGMDMDMLLHYMNKDESNNREKSERCMEDG